VLRALQVEHPFTGKYLLMGAESSWGQVGACSTTATILGSVSSRREHF